MEVLTKLKRVFTPNTQPLGISDTEEVSTSALDWLGEVLKGTNLDPNGIRTVAFRILEEETSNLSFFNPDKPQSLTEQQDWAKDNLNSRVDELIAKGVDPTALITAIQQALPYAVERLGLEES